MTRLEANIRIVAHLSAAILKYPEQRFGQLLVNLDIVQNKFIYDDGNQIKITQDPYNTESIDILANVQKAMDKLT